MMMKKRFSIAIFVVAVLIEFAFAANCLADGFMRELMGTIPGGRGGTDIAYPGSGMSVYDNPAALTDVEGSMAEADLDFLYLVPNFENRYGNDENGDVWVELPSLSYVQNAGSRFGLGVGVYHPAGCATEYDNIDHPIFGEGSYRSYVALSELLLAGSYKPIDSLSIGVGVGGAYSKEKLHMPYTFQTGPLAGVSALTDLKADDTALTWNLGLQWRPVKGTTVGMAYHPERRFRMEGHINLDLDNMNALLPTPLPDPDARYVVDYDLVWPQTLGLGVTQQITDAFNVSVEFTWYAWQRAFQHLRLKLSDGDNPYYDYAAGTDSPHDTLPMEWKDAYSLKFGAEYAVTKTDTVRIGYVYEKNPIPDDTLLPVMAAICKDEITAGFSHAWENVTASLSYGYIFTPNKQHVDESEVLDTVGQYNDSDVDFHAHFISVGAQYRF